MREHIHDELWALWEQSAHQELLKRTTKALQKSRKTSFLERLRKKVVPDDTPLTALHGAALMEAGQTAEGLRWLRLYKRKAVSRIPPKFSALLLFYEASQEFVQGSSEKAESLLAASLRKHECGRSRELWTAHFAHPPDSVPSQELSPATTEVPLWSRLHPEERNLHERLSYLIPCSGPLELEPVELPEGWKDYGRHGLKLLSFPAAQLEKHLNLDSLNAWLQTHALPLVRQLLLTAPHFLLLKGEFQQHPHFGAHQTALALCRAACGAGADGVLDRYAQRWLPPAALDSAERDLFEIKDHIGIQITNGLCLTRGLTPKFGAPEYAIKVPAPHLAGAAVYLLNEIAHQVAHGKRYGEKSLFRWRSGGHLCQLMFRPLDEDSDQAAFEAVDLAVENRVVKPSVNATAAITYFTQAAPHWDNGFGWPPRVYEPPEGLADSPSILGLVPGLVSKSQVMEVLGEPGRVLSPDKWRWAFEFPESDQPLRVEARFQGDHLLSLESNSLTAGPQLLVEATREEVMKFLGTPTLTRDFVAPPDQVLVRQELAWVLPHSQRSRSTILCALHFDAQDKLIQSSLYQLNEATTKVKESLQDSWGKALLTSFAPEIPRKDRPLSADAVSLRVQMESTARLLNQLATQFGRGDWLGEELNGCAMITGAYLIGEGIPKRGLLEELGLPADLFLESFEELEIYLHHPKIRMRFEGKARAKSVPYKELAAFCWLLERLENSTTDDLELAVDLAQVFGQYRVHLEQILPRGG